MKLSIITICKNEASRIRQTADSVIGQDTRDFEWIVFDGGSTDGTTDILGEYKSEMAHFKSGADGGIYAAMNAAAAIAKGRYLYWLNGGDYIAHTDSIRKCLELAHDEIAIGNILIKYPKTGREQLRDYRDVSLDMDYLYWRCFPHQSTWISRDLFERCGPYNAQLKIAADRDFFCRAIRHHGAKVQKLPVLMAVFYNDGLSANAKTLFPEQRIFERRRIRRLYYPWTYRVRRGANEWWGRVQHGFRTRWTKQS